MIVTKMTEREYRALPAMNATALACLAEATPAHWEWERLNGKRTQAMELGIALHQAVLEPHEFRANYACPPECDRRTKAGKEAWELFKAENPDKTYLDAEEWATVVGMANAVLSHSEAMRWLGVCADRELCIVGDLDGIPAKCRIDAIDQQHGLFLDIKSTRNRANRAECEQSAHKLNYFLRLAFYRRMMLAAGMPWGGCSVVWVESKPPHCVNVLPMAEWAIDLMERPLDRAILSYRDWMRDPTEGWPTKGTSMGLPAWFATTLEVEDHS